MKTKVRCARIWCAVTAVALVGSLACAEVVAEEVVALGERSIWLDLDEIAVAYTERSLCLGSDEIRVAYGETNFELMVFRDLPANATDDDIRAAIQASHMKDQTRTLPMVLGSLERYREFRQWANGIGGLAVADSEYAAYSFAFGVEDLFLNEPSVSFTGVAASELTPGALSVTVTVTDGDKDKSVSSAKVAKMFEATTNVTDWTSASRLEPQVTDCTKSVSTPVVYEALPGDGKPNRAFLRLKLP